MKKEARENRKDTVIASPRPSKTVIIANGVAAICMFLSWLGQNVYQSEMGARKSDIERNMQFASTEMTKALQWMLTFQMERRKEKPDPEIILNSAMGYAETVETIIEAARQVDPSSAVLTSHINDLQKLMKPLRAAAHQRNLQEIEETASVIMLWFKTIGPEAHEAVNTKAIEINAKEGGGKWMFRIFFILGSIIFAGTWWRSHIPVTVWVPNGKR